MGDQLLVEVDADPPAHADDHPLAVERREPALEVVDEVLGDQPDPVLGPDDHLQLGPLRLQLLLSVDLLPLGRLLEQGVDEGPLGILQLRLCPLSQTLNWLTAAQSFFSGASKSTTFACVPAMEPSFRRYSTVIPSTIIR